jgi:WD40 repeat protein
MRRTLAIKPCQTMRGHTNLVRGVVHLPSGRRIITCSYDCSLRLWDLESGAQIGNDWRDERDKAGVSTIALSPNGNTVASGSSDGMVKLWDVKTGKVVAKWTGHSGLVWRVCWNASGDCVASGSNDGTARVWDVVSGNIILGPIKTGHQNVYAVIYSPDTTKIVTGGFNENAIKIWDAKTGELLSTVKHEHSVWSLAWTSNQKKLISRSSDGLVRIFDTNTWRQIALLEGDLVCGISLFQNNRLLATASKFDTTVRLWNLDTNLPVGPVLHHVADISRAAIDISPDGKLLVTCCEDNNAYVWDIHTILKDAGLDDLLSIPDVSGCN